MIALKYEVGDRIKDRHAFIDLDRLDLMRSAADNSRSSGIYGIVGKRFNKVIGFIIGQPRDLMGMQADHHMVGGFTGCADGCEIPFTVGRVWNGGFAFRL